MATILIAEDDDNVRRLQERLLTRFGHAVIATHNGREALYVASTDIAIDLVMTDIDMPLIDGITLIRELALLRPTLPVLVCSGTRNVVPGVPLLAKPFSPESLRDAVDVLLARQAAPQR